MVISLRTDCLKQSITMLTERFFMETCVCSWESTNINKIQNAKLNEKVLYGFLLNYKKYVKTAHRALGRNLDLLLISQKVITELLMFLMPGILMSCNTVMYIVIDILIFLYKNDVYIYALYIYCCHCVEVCISCRLINTIVSQIVLYWKCDPNQQFCPIRR